MKMEDLDSQQRGFINQLLTIFREEKSPNTLFSIFTRLGNIQFLPDLDLDHILLDEVADAIPLLIVFLATPRLDGQRRYITLTLLDIQLAMEIVDAVKQVLYKKLLNFVKKKIRDSK
jgi:hypothetical protein